MAGAIAGANGNAPVKYGNDNKTFSATLAEIQINGKTVGLMKNVRVNETFQRGRVVGIGRVTPVEIPLTGWNGTISCSGYAIRAGVLGTDAVEAGDVVNGIVPRDHTDGEQWARKLLYTDGITIVIKAKWVPGSADPNDPVNGIVATETRNYIKIQKAFLTGDSFEISEGQIAGKDSTFEYLDPYQWESGS
jgi:hypothetical protein